jgi:hypothetical protein
MRMSRSRRKTPVHGLCADSDKPFKRMEHRRERRAVKVALAASDDPPNRKTFGSPWASCKDGKRYMPDPEPKDMRK